MDDEYALVPTYSRYAELYDELDQDHFGLSVLPLIEQAAERHGLVAHSALDLACGTGTVAVRLARSGLQVAGVDRSREMLGIARRKAQEAGVQVAFLHQDMASLDPPAQADLVLCLYDSLNYLLRPAELESTIAAVARALRPQGLFLFDANTPHCLAHDWGNQVIEERGDSAMLVHRYSYDCQSRIGTLELYCLANRSERIQRFREIHRERGYSKCEIEGTLRRAGLTLLEAFSLPDLAEPREDSSRLFYVAGRPRKGQGGQR